MAHRPSSCLRVAVLAAFVAAALPASVRPSIAQSVEQEVELSVKLLELSVAEWRERVALPAADATDGQARSAALTALQKKYKVERDKLYEAYFTTAAEHLAFFASHAGEVEGYLEEAADIRARIEMLTQTLRTLIEQAEARPGVPQGVPQ